MLILATGVPGTGKTLNTIKQVLTEDRFKNRSVFFCGITGCVVPGWIEWSLDEAKNWWSALPENAILIIDESYKFAPATATGVRPPDYVEKLAEHRHKGVDIFFVCQHPTQLSTFVRKMVGNHFHYERKFGFNRSLRFEWQEAQADPTHWAARRDALKKQISFDKKIFSLYKSAEVHTHKRRIPFKLVGAVLSLVVVAGLVASVLARHSPQQVVSTASAVLPLAGPRSGPVSAEDYLKQRQPRIDGLPWTAPIYDKAYQVKTFPRPNCVLNTVTEDCRCYSQQGTRMDVPSNFCRDIVDNGWFDPTKDENKQELVAGGLKQAPGNGDRQPGNGWVMLENSRLPGTSDTPLDESKSASGQRRSL